MTFHVTCVEQSLFDMLGTYRASSEWISNEEWVMYVEESRSSEQPCVPSRPKKVECRLRSRVLIEIEAQNSAPGVELGGSSKLVAVGKCKGLEPWRVRAHDKSSSRALFQPPRLHFSEGRRQFTCKGRIICWRQSWTECVNFWRNVGVGLRCERRGKTSIAVDTESFQSAPLPRTMERSLRTSQMMRTPRNRQKKRRQNCLSSSYSSKMWVSQILQTVFPTASYKILLTT